jgi:DNA (cytosine-5)-methyltransferase 1
MNELALFAGAGGGILGGLLLGWRTVCAVECDPYAASVLIARQNDGALAPFPVWDDVRTFDGRRWHGVVDVVSGGFPCQDISVAGKGAGIDGARSGLWGHMARIVGEVRPQFVYVENSPILTSRGLGRVLGDLAALGFDAEWDVVSAGDLGADHTRERIWIVAHAHGYGPQEREHVARAGDAPCNGEQTRGQTDRAAASNDAPDPDRGERSLWRANGRMGWLDQPVPWDRAWPITAQPVLGRGAHGVAHRVDRLKALGNGQVPRVAAAAFAALAREFE